MAKQRVFQLAKELGVNSKDIIAKCEAEGVPSITNHMSAVSAGLAATNKEWFGEGDGGVATAVETTSKIDVSKARAKARKKAPPKSAPPAEAPPIAKPEAAAPVVEEARAPEAKPEVKAPAAEAQGIAPPAEQAEPAPEAEAVAPTPAEAPAAKAPSTPEVPASADEPADAASEDGRAKGRPNVPNRPQAVGPAGPMLTEPKKTTLAGPKVIRVEAPEVITPPRKRTGPRPTGPGGGGVGAPSDGAGADRGGRSTSSRRNKRRSATAGDAGKGATRLAPVDRQFNWREQDLLEREQRLNRSGGYFRSHRRDNLKRSGGAHRATTPAESGGQVRIEEPISVKSLSSALGIKAADIVKKLFLDGKPTTVNSGLATEDAIEIAAEYDIELDVVEQKTAKDEIVEQFADRAMVNEQSRSPVVTILGHVDHGKTTLLDSIRNAKVAQGEAGGITQATSAFQVPVKVGDATHQVTFIDTPGHEAFTEMRSRGAKVTDIAVLVVAADDGVMPQTIESINHAKSAGVPIVVALNKVDKPEATDSNIQRILGELAEHGLTPTDWGGNTEVMRVSALKGEGITELLEILDYQAELLELKADFGGPAAGSVIEAQLEEGRGPVARCLVQQGQLKKGDVIVIGRAYGRVRDIVNDSGQRITEAGPSSPIAISGINEVPNAGDKFYVVKNIRAAEAAAQERVQAEREKGLAREKVTLDNIFQKLAESGKKELPLVVKADVNGSVETLRSTLSKIANSEVSVAIKHAAVGPVNESDVSLAETAGAIIVAFNVSAIPQARKAAEERKVDLRYYDVIYDLTDDVTRAAEGLLAPELKLEVLGHAEVREVFRVSKVGMIAGCYVTDGTIQRNALIRVTREGIVIEKDRKLSQLKRFKDDAKEVRAGQECGMNIEGYDDIKVGDVLECYITKEVRRSLSD